MDAEIVKKVLERLRNDHNLGRTSFMKEFGLTGYAAERAIKEARKLDPSIPQAEKNFRSGKQSKPKSKKKGHEKKVNFTERANMAEDAKKFDPLATADDCIEDLRRVQKANPYRFITRTGYRAEGAYSEKTWNQFFGTFQEFRRQAGLELSRYQHQHEKNIAKHASLDHYRQFYMNEIASVHQLYPRAERKRVNTIIAISDNHDEEQDPFVWRVFKEIAKDLDPDVVLFNGDQGDLYEFSRFKVDPRQARAAQRLAFIRDSIFGEIRELLPDTQIDWNLGNHEWRVQKHFADRSPDMLSVLADFHGWNWADFFGVRDLEINVNCKWDLSAYNRIDVIEQVKNNFIVYWDCFVAKHIIDTKLGISGTSGHVHNPETKAYVNLARGRRSPYNWTVTGAACRGEAEYIETLDKSGQGFAIFHIMPDTGIVVPENVVIQGDFAAVGGRYFYRREDER